MFNNMISSQTVQKFEGSNFKNDTVNAESAKITN